MVMTQADGTTVTVGDEMMDFTRPRPRRPFRVDADVFYQRPALSAGTMLRAVKLNDQIVDATDDDEKQIELTRQFMALVLEPESAALFSRRLTDDDNPIEIVQINQIMPWLLSIGADAARPTEPSSSSSTGSPSPAPGTSSTAPAPSAG